MTSPVPMLDVSLRHDFGAFTLDIAFEAPPGVTALFGPSGSGKSSIVAMLAGLVKPDHGRIVLGGRTLLDTAHRKHVSTHNRRLGVVFQDGRLFPHMTVRKNLNYARASNTDEPAIVHLLGIEHLLDRRPAKLSGGEKQRVAIGRALMSDPTMLLMDEPLASLDAPRRAEIMPWLERLRDEGRHPHPLRLALRETRSNASPPPSFASKPAA